MVNRRQFIGAGTAASVAAAVAASSMARAGDAALGPLPLGTKATAMGSDIGAASGLLESPHIALFDERFETGRRYGATMRRRGVPVHAIRGDVTGVWYSRLHPLWKGAPARVAGMTAYAAMFCLERLAWDHGLRMRHLGTHAPGRASGIDLPLHSWIITPADGRRDRRRLSAA